MIHGKVEWKVGQIDKIDHYSQMSRQRERSSVESNEWHERSQDYWESFKHFYRIPGVPVQQEGITKGVKLEVVTCCQLTN